MLCHQQVTPYCTPLPKGYSNLETFNPEMQRSAHTRVILPCWWGDIPDAWSELRFCSLVGRVTRSVTGSAPVPWSLVSTTCTMEAHFGVVYSFSNTGWGAENTNKWHVQHFKISETLHIYIFKAFTVQRHVSKIRIIQLHLLCCTHVCTYKQLITWNIK